MAAAERTHRGAVHHRAFGEERWKRPDLLRTQLPGWTWIVPFDPAVEAAVAYLASVHTDGPGAGGHADDRIGAQVRAQVHADVVGAVGRVIELVVDADEAAVVEAPVLDELARLHRADPLPLRREHFDEIGRASCRERVYISGGGR